MGFKKTLFRVAGIAAMIVVVNTCLTDRKPLHVQDSPKKTQTHEKVTATLRFVNENILKAKYKEEVNPFLTDYYRMQLRRIVVFELTVENKSPDTIRFDMNRLELQYGVMALQPYNRFQLGQHWLYMDEETKAIYKVRRKKIIESTVLPNSYAIQAGSIKRGYVVFLGNTPNYGPAMVYAPLFISKDVLFHRFEFSFEFLGKPQKCTNQSSVLFGRNEP